MWLIHIYFNDFFSQMGLTLSFILEQDLNNLFHKKGERKNIYSASRIVLVALQPFYYPF